MSLHVPMSSGQERIPEPDPSVMTPAPPRDVTQPDDDTLIPDTKDQSAPERDDADPRGSTPVTNDVTRIDDESAAADEGSANRLLDEEEVIDVSSEDSMDASDPPSFTPTQGPSTSSAP